MRKGSSHTEETKRKIGLTRKGQGVGVPLSEEHRQKISRARRGRSRNNTGPAAGFYVDSKGYRVLTGHQEHPLAGKNGAVFEHRKVLYDKIGPGPHPCYWNCGKDLEWSEIEADHLNKVRSDNDPSNLVPSCHTCNARR